ncbi:oligosaccharide flippase family protein [Nocardia huaxiensis]|uniref:Oligosaccharide flippase family protein n=1 Tax=Nocardia huaxiensis TaxID=2755382 RepID=A0A7D6Z8M8_9NOCA|nr:oligosaccharide flippase family protein [Nocardia huaxiensis]QLY27718.1 oligosaccharide flippase family protein [Nocardia huaxiensis]
MHRFDGNPPDRATVRAYDLIWRHIHDAPTEQLPIIDGPLPSGLGRVRSRAAEIARSDTGEFTPVGGQGVAESVAVATGMPGAEQDPSAERSLPGDRDLSRSAAHPAEKNLTQRIGSVAAASAVALVVGEVVTLGQTVALARLLSPAEVGMFAAGTVLTMLLTTFVEGGLRAGLVQRADRVEDAAETVFRASFVNGIVMTLGAVAAAPLIGLVFHNHTVGLIAASTSGFLLIFSLTNVPEGLLQREFSVKRRIIVGPAVSVSFAVVAITMAALGFGVWSMVAGTYVSYVVWVALTWWLAKWRPGRGRASWRLWRELARYGSPVVVNLLGARAQGMIEAAVVGRGLSSAALGHFRYGQRIAQIPVRFIVEVGAFSLFPAFSRIAEDPDRSRLAGAYLRAIRLATVGAAALSGLVIALGQPAVVLVFGEPWREAGAVVMAMAGLGLGKAWMSVSEEAIKGAGRTGLLNWQTAVELVLGISLLLAGIHFFGLIGVGLATSVTVLLVAVVVTGMARSVIGVPLLAFLRAAVPPLPAGAIALAVCWWLEHQVLQADTRSIALGIGVLFVDVAAFAVVYLLALSVLAPSVVRGFARLVIRLASRLIARNGKSGNPITVNAEPRISRETN